MFSYPIRLTLLALACGVYLSGCGSLNTRTTEKAPREPGKRETAVVPPYTGGGYYKDDGPGDNPPDNLDTIPDAQPRREAPHPFANRIYKVRGQRYIPDVSGQAYRTRGLASWYGRKFHGRPTSSGEPYDMYAMSAAHRTLPIPSYARVTNVDTGDSVVVRINDRGPFHNERLIDLSYTAAHKLGVLKQVTLVEVERLLPDGEEVPATLSAEARADEPPTPRDPSRSLAQRAAPEPSTGAVQAVYLQVGAFSNAQAADELTGRLMQKLGRALPGVLRLEDGGLIKVQVGPFTSMAAADAATAMVEAAADVRPYKFTAAGAATAQARGQETAPATVPATTTVVLEPVAAEAEGVAGAVGTGANLPVLPAYWLQLAAFRKDEAADALIQRVQSQAELPGVEKRLDQGLTKVQAGPYASAALADEAASQLAALLGQKPYRILR